MEGDRAVAFARGAVGQLEPITSRDVELELIEHNAMIPAAGYGARWSMSVARLPA